MRAMRKKLNVFMLSIYDIYTFWNRKSWLVQMGTLQNWSKRNRLFCCREVNAMLMASAKILEREESISPCKFILWVTACLHVCFIYLGDQFFFCSCGSWAIWAHWVNLKFYLSLCGFNQVKWGREMSQDFLLLPQGFESFPSDLPLVTSRNLVCV